MSQYQLDKLDKRILEMLSVNARIPFLEIARENNVSGAAVHQRIQKLTDDQQSRVAGVVVDVFQAQLCHGTAAVAQNFAYVHSRSVRFFSA